MSGGLWGGVNSGRRYRYHRRISGISVPSGVWSVSIPHMKELLIKSRVRESYLEDMAFLSKVVWPIVHRSVYQHDSFSCHAFGGGHPFPTVRHVNGEHVGGVYINGKLRDSDVVILKH